LAPALGVAAQIRCPQRGVFAVGVEIGPYFVVGLDCGPATDFGLRLVSNLTDEDLSVGTPICPDFRSQRRRAKFNNRLQGRVVPECF
jgi:hypothetical protein